MSKTNFSRFRRLVYAVIAGALLILLSCSRYKPNEPVKPVQYVELSDTTEVLADTTLALLSSVEDSVLAFSRSNTQLATVSDSDIIICGISDQTPYGFLGRVRVSQQDTTASSSLEPPLKKLSRTVGLISRENCRRRM